MEEREGGGEVARSGTDVCEKEIKFLSLVKPGLPLLFSNGVCAWRYSFRAM